MAKEIEIKERMYKGKGSNFTTRLKSHLCAISVLERFQTQRKTFLIDVRTAWITYLSQKM